MSTYAQMDRKEWAVAMLGMPMEYSVSPLRSRPWVTWSLMVVIALVNWVLLFVPEAVQRFGFEPALPWRHGGLTLLTSFFLHGSLFHIAANLYFLYVFGDNVEDFLGRWRYLGLLLAASFAGDFLHALFNLESLTPVIGASGGISGVMVFYALAFPDARVGFFWYAWITMSVRRALALWLVLQVLGAVFSQAYGGGGVAYLGHLGGAAAGAIAWMVWASSQRSAAIPVPKR